jgi:hypothetical protein
VTTAPLTIAATATPKSIAIPAAIATHNSLNKVLPSW